MNVGAPPDEPPPARASPEKAFAKYQLDWYAGASALIDIARMGDKAGQFALRYGSPFRSTMRAPAGEIDVGYDPLKRLADELPGIAGIGISRGGPAGAAGGPPGASVEGLTSVGQRLATYVLPPFVSTDLARRPDLFVEIGTDEMLVPLPWELMHDGEEFYCLRHFVGRFVNLSSAIQSFGGGSSFGPAQELGELRALLVAVARPKPIGGLVFPPLPGAEAEVQSVLETMMSLNISVDLLAGPNATTAGFQQRLLSGRPYHIIHFVGHASFKPDNPRASALILDDGAITTGELTALFKKQQGCVLCFVNACETTSPPEQDADGASPVELNWDRQYDIFGLARSFLESGSYLLGSRWLLPDRPAALFAKTFYQFLLGSGAPIGKAITEARREVRKEHPDDISWASYIYYGDPRLCFKLLEEPGAAAPVAPERREATLNAPDATPAPGGVSMTAAAPAELPTADIEALRKLGAEYDQIRATIDSGPTRTAKMTRIVSEATASTSRADPSPCIGDLLRGSDGERIVALALLQSVPDPQHVRAVVDAIDNSHSAFEQYQALAVAIKMAPRLTTEQADLLRPVLRDKLGQPRSFGTDRAVLARRVLALLGDASTLPSVVDNDKVTGTIDYPETGQVVRRTFKCSGTVAGMQRGLSLWLAVEVGPLVWPKESVVTPDQDNKWSATVFEDGASEAFAVGLYVGDSTVDIRIRNWFEVGKRTGIYSELKGIPGARRVARIEDLHLDSGTH